MPELLHDYHDLFAQHEDDIGWTDLVEHSTHNEGTPVRVPYHHKIPMVREEEDAHVCQMLWTTRDSTTRIKDAHPLPRIDDNLEALHGVNYFSTQDLKSGYWQIPFREENKEKSAFQTSSGQLYECEMMAFGLCNASVTFSRLMDFALTGLKW